MDILAIAALCYVAIGVVLFAHPPAPACPDDFDWRRQLGVFGATLPEVLLWPVALWCFARAAFNRD